MKINLVDITDIKDNSKWISFNGQDTSYNNAVRCNIAIKKDNITDVIFRTTNKVEIYNDTNVYNLTFKSLLNTDKVLRKCLKI